MIGKDMIMKAQQAGVFKEGMRDSIALGIPFVLLYLSFGMLGTEQGLSLTGSLATTVFVYSTPLQVLLMQSHSSGWILAPVILMLNARFALMAAALSPYVKETKNSRIFASAILIAPSIFTGCITRFKHDTRHAFHYFLGMGIPLYVVSILCTLVGAMAGAGPVSPAMLAIMTMILPLQITSMMARHWPHYFDVGSYWIGFILSPLLVHFFGKYNLLLTPFLAGAAMVLLENHRKKGRTE